MFKKLDAIPEPLRSIIIALFFVVTGVLSVMSIHFGEVAKSPLAWTLWDISAVVSPILFIGGIIAFGKSKGSDKDIQA